MYAGRPLSWLRDDSVPSILDSWGAVYRDVIILDTLNNRVDTWNLTNNDLRVQSNRDTMKKKLRTAATPADTDNDRLPDYWERWAYGSLSRSGSYRGPDGITALVHYAHCSRTPLSGALPGGPDAVLLPFDGAISLTWTARRGRALGLSVVPEFSPSLAAWSLTGHGWEEWNRFPLYDGSGGEIIEWRSVGPSPWPYARVRMTLP